MKRSELAVGQRLGYLWSNHFPPEWVVVEALDAPVSGRSSLYHNHPPPTRASGILIKFENPHARFGDEGKRLIVKHGRGLISPAAMERALAARAEAVAKAKAQEDRRLMLLASIRALGIEVPDDHLLTYAVLESVLAHAGLLQVP